MEYFPIFINLNNRRCLIIGGGSVALRKATTLLEFNADITVISPNVIDEFKSLDLKIITRNFKTSDLIDVFLVVTATDDLQLNQDILNICQDKNILCNSATNITNNGYIFPAVAIQESICVGVTTNAESPYISKLIKSEIQTEVLPKYKNALEVSKQYRKALNNQDIPSKIKGKIIKQLIDYTLTEEIIPSKEMVQHIINENR